jgi:Family of unknown function (DUF6082)
LISRMLYRLLLALLAVCGVALILISPLGLEKFTTIKSINWAQLSNIGQTYGAVSALIAGIALAAVAISLFFQARSLTLSQMQMMRTFHSDLIKFTIENPELLPSWGFAREPNSTIEDIQRTGFVNILAAFWITSYRTGAISAAELRGNFSTAFNGEAGRKWWIDSGKNWTRSAKDRRSRHAVMIIEEEFRKAESLGPPIVTARLWTNPEQHDSATLKLRRPGHKTEIILAFGAGIAAARAVFRNQRLSTARVGSN